MTRSAADRPFRRRVLVNTGAVAIGNGWAMVVALVSLPLVLRGLGAVSFGTWALLQTFSAVSGWFSLLDLGLSTAATRAVAARHAVDDHEGLGSAVGTTLASLAVLGIASGLVLALVGPFVLPHVFRTPPRLHHQLRIGAVAFAVQVAFDLLCGGFQSILDGYQRIDRSRAIDAIRRTGVAAATSVVALTSHRLDRVAIASAAATIAGAVVGAWVLHRTIRGTRPTVSRRMAGEIFRYGRTVAVLRPLGVLQRTIDRFVVGAILGPAAVSLVEVATQLQNGTDAVLSATSYAVIPGSARLHARGDRDKLREMVLTGTRYVLLATWPVAALTAILGGPAIHLWVGGRYHEAAVLVALGVASLALVAPAQVSSNILLGTGRAGTILRVALLAIVINVVGSIGLVHAVGVAGTFEATILAAAVTLPMLLRPTLRDLEIATPDFLRRAAAPAIAAPVAASIAAGIVVALPLGAIVTLLLGGALGVGAAAAATLRWGLLPSETQAITRRLRGRR
jgi:O-antigen/teichoic acid export membrane protein